MCMLRVSMWPLSKIVQLDFGIVQTVWYFFSFYSFLLRSQIKPYSPGYGKKNQLALDNTSSLASVLALYSGNVEFDVKTSYSVNMALTDHANMTANITCIRIFGGE